MARNKHPEETVNRIVDVASRLFLEKGYNQTSIQDIVDHLGSLSKGAIYHHFKSKVEIWIAVADRMTADSEQLFEHILSRRDLNGLEKLKAIFRDSLFRPSQDNLLSIAPTTSNPQLLLSILHPSAPPSRKSAKVLDPFLRESFPKRAMSLSRIDAGVSRRYLCFRPSGGATRSERDIPGGMDSP